MCVKEFAPVEELKVWPSGGQLWLEWKPPNRMLPSEYVVEWVSDDGRDWQREHRNTRLTTIKGNLFPLKYQSGVCDMSSICNSIKGIFQPNYVPTENDPLN